MTNLNDVIRHAARGNFNKVNEFFQAYPNLVNSFSNNRNCLHVASYNGHVEIVSFLLDLSASPTMTDNNGYSALHYAVIGNQIEVVKVLVGRGAIINAADKNGRTPLEIAGNRGYAEIVSFLILKGATLPPPFEVTKTKPCCLQ